MVAKWLHMMLEAAAAGGPTSMMEFTRLLTSSIRPPDTHDSVTVAGGAVITPLMLDVLSSGGVTSGQALAQGPKDPLSEDPHARCSGRGLLIHAAHKSSKAKQPKTKEKERQSQSKKNGKLVPL
ncbi:hypothetical protein THAOC_15501 [Thalassiosira oceanica]|uniref:Uncharacterized protein n=1 Tax=Thalassiosira oceanica TaxID=159749 RepID=K0S6X1_THAOC|nr:hypothetical protein THAOC_17585 [Thalassiosira oceanica]EJK63823.1 hypothetical protein THAOC_15501 [Thalassiosira oceanica]|eukprot:EJK61848.1 hypothetical protein THAOC_17585 [Thalassiosira oceanica]